MSVVGIDLGTTNTVVGSVRGGKVHVLADETGARLLPSVVSFHPNGEVLAFLNESGLAPTILPFPPDALAELVALVADGTLSRNLAKDVLGEGLRSGTRPRQVVEERGLAQVNDADELAGIVDQILAVNADAVEEYRAADDKARKKKRGFLMGELMKATKGSANPQVLNQLLDDRLA